jgi:thymidylate kinase
MYQLLKIKILSLRYNDLVVIYERSVIDTIADIINDTGLEEYAKSLTRMASLIMRMTRESPLIMLFDVEPKVAYERKDDVPNISFLRDHREAYKLIMKYFPTPIPIDTGRPCYENISKILQVVSNYLQNS